MALEAAFKLSILLDHTILRNTHLFKVGGAGSIGSFLRVCLIKGQLGSDVGQPVIFIGNTRVCYFIYASAHFGAYYGMDIIFWYSGVYHMKRKEDVVFFRTACKMQILCMICILTLQ